MYTVRALKSLCIKRGNVMPSGSVRQVVYTEHKLINRSTWCLVGRLFAWEPAALPLRSFSSSTVRRPQCETKDPFKLSGTLLENKARYFSNMAVYSYPLARRDEEVVEDLHGSMVRA